MPKQWSYRRCSLFCLFASLSKVLCLPGYYLYYPFLCCFDLLCTALHWTLHWAAILSDYKNSADVNPYLHCPELYGTRVSKCHRLTILWRRKIDLTFCNILRFVLANWKIHDFFSIFPSILSIFTLFMRMLRFFLPFFMRKTVMTKIVTAYKNLLLEWLYGTTKGCNKKNKAA